MILAIVWIMAKSSKRNRDRLAFLTAGIGGIAVVVAYFGFSKDMFVWALSGLIILGSIALGTALLVKYFIDERNKQRLQALSEADISVMSGKQFQVYVCILLRKQGYKGVKEIEPSRDLGVDIIARKDGVTWGVQVKRYASKVGPNALGQVLRTLKRHNCERGMVVTNSTFTGGIIDLAKDNNIVLIGRDELADWIIEFQSKKLQTDNQP